MKIGSDPEGIVIDGEGYHISASRIIDDPDCEKEIGCDGHSFTLEFRPHPGNPDEHLKNIEMLITQFSQKYPNHDIKSGSYVAGEPIGGHIHFSCLHSSEKQKFLNYYLAVPILMLEDSRSAQRRRRSGYGGLNNYRIKPWGWEYRTLPSWIIGKGITKAVLRAAWIIIHKYDLMPSPPPQKDWEDEFYNAEKQYIKPHAFRALKQLMKFAPSHDYKLSIASLKSLIHLNKDWQEERPIIKRWKGKGNTKIYGNCTDFMICSILKEIEILPKKKYILYGIRDTHNCDIILPKSLEGKIEADDLKIKFYNTPFAERNDWATGIGISNSMRERGETHCAKIVQKIITLIEGIPQ